MNETLEAPPYSIAIVEDDATLRESLIEIINCSSRWQVSAAFSDGASALDALVQSPVSVVLMDIQLPGMSGIECVGKLTALQPATQVIMVTVYDNNDRIFNALAAGAEGYLLKRDIPTKLLDALDDLIAGGSPMSGAIARKVVHHFQNEVPDKTQKPKLTPRETEILDLLVKGFLYKEIAWELSITLETVRTHLHNIYKKLHVRTRTEAVVKHLGHGQ
ncbi:response regulator transcription factor [Luteolibacter pohnpeiensis]|uniref:Response regulator transcription factor n=1 Tax=Luteolibacter pohnpeiensis TaxID=454153 RepID=A0A934SC20_9BACT|nr:response regulator transcription factor [Luteolibacter pohnpeiensis]MBK1882528.1 response regulator transcription factor [Luteolibacter pohnpeiensis]